MSKMGKHTSMGKELKRSVKRLESLPYVDKIVLGRAEAARHTFAPGTLRYKFDSPGGIKVNGYTGTGVIDIYIKVDPAYHAELIEYIKK